VKRRLFGAGALAFAATLLVVILGAVGVWIGSTAEHGARTLAPVCFFDMLLSSDRTASQRQKQ
jgi:hypothetical protein